MGVSAVFGLIGATKGNDIGIAGVAGDCKIMLIRVGFFGTDGKLLISSLYMIKGIIYAADNGARVINISSGNRKYHESLINALKYAIDKGAVIVCSAGNYGTNEKVYPAAYKLSGLISVGASSRSDTRCRFSGYGIWVNVSAPGEFIMSTLLFDRYGRVKGTSLSAPLVSGIAGLILSKYPFFTPEEVKNVIGNSVDRCEGLEDANITSGRVNAYKAVSNPCTDPLEFDDSDNDEKISLKDNRMDQGCLLACIWF